MQNSEITMSEQKAYDLHASIQSTRKWASFMSKVDVLHALTYPKQPAIMPELEVICALTRIPNPINLY